MAMTREEWRTRLLDAGIPDDVVDTFLARVKDDDLVRMKDLSAEKLKEVLELAAKKAKVDTEGDVEEDAEGDAPDAAKEKDDTDLSESTGALIDLIADAVISKLKDELASVQVSVPQMPQLDEVLTRITAIEESVASLGGHLQETAATLKDSPIADEELVTAMAELLKDLSPASKARMRTSVNDTVGAATLAYNFRKRQEAGRKESPSMQKDEPTSEGVVIRDSEGNEYASLTDMADGKPLKDS